MSLSSYRPQGNVPSTLTQCNTGNGSNQWCEDQRAAIKEEQSILCASVRKKIAVTWISHLVIQSLSVLIHWYAMLLHGGLYSVLQPLLRSTKSRIILYYNPQLLRWLETPELSYSTTLDSSGGPELKGYPFSTTHSFEGSLKLKRYSVSQSSSSSGVQELKDYHGLQPSSP